MRRVLLVLALVGFLAAHAAARAGGGQSYSGGSYSTSSSYSHSSSSDYGSYSYGRNRYTLGDMFITFVILHPVIGIPLTLFLLYAFVVMNNTSESGVEPLSGGLIRGAAQLSSKKAEELARLRARDPAFDERAFLGRAGAAFLKIQAAWSAGDMSPARAFISDGVNERFGRQLAGLKAAGLSNLMENVEVRDTEVLACRSDRHFDALWVRVAASATDRTVDAGGMLISGSSVPSRFEEVWTFLRRPGAKTLKSPGLIEGLCPSCGAPLPIADAAQCAACKTWVNSGEYDWVLTEITQSCEWSMREPSRDVDGWTEVSAADPALSLAALEDRASVLFWRGLEGRELAAAAVGAVETVAFENAGAWTRAHIEVKWSSGEGVRRDFYVLSRASGAKTDARQGLRTARCAACGAPPMEGASENCGYCGAALNDGKKDWILTEVIPFGKWRRPFNAPAAASAPAAAPAPAGASWGTEMSPADAYAVLALAMLADGEESLAEKSFLDSYAQARGLPPAKAAAISAAARAGKLDAPKPEDGAQAEAILRGMIRMSLADGVVTVAERTALNSFAGRFGLWPDDVAGMIAEERAALA